MRQKLLRKQTSVTRVRNEIDITDRMILMLLSYRQELVFEVGKWKKDHKKSILDPKREQEILTALLDLAPEANLDASFIKNIYRQVFEHSRLIQKRV